MNPAQANRNSTKILAIHPADEVARPLPLIPIFIITVCFFLRRSTYLGALIVSPSPVRAGCGNVKAARAACGGVAHPAHRGTPPHPDGDAHRLADVDPVLLFVALFPDSTMLTAPAAGSALTADVMTGRSFRTGRPRNGRWRTRTGRPTSGRLVSIQRAGLAGV